MHGFLLADGGSAKALTGIDDHSRYCVSARLMTSERTQSVCDGFNSAMQTYGVPLQVPTDNGKVFTGRFAQPPVEVLFDRTTDYDKLLGEIRDARKKLPKMDAGAVGTAAARLRHSCP